MSEFAALIERLEKATGPDSELDQEIWFSLEQPLPDEPVGFPIRYTASIDAALTLVPPSHVTDVHDDEDKCFPTGFSITSLCGSEYQAEVIYHPTWNVEPPPLGEGYSPTPAIALCIAALKARKAE